VKLQPNSLFRKELLRATVRGALDGRREADISDSTFLGKASKGPVGARATPFCRTQHQEGSRNKKETTALKSEQREAKAKKNAVDEMMDLERELKNMDMALEMGNSIASLDARAQQRMKSSVVDGSFMVIPPGSGSYMASSALWNSNNVVVPSSSNNLTPASSNRQQHHQPQLEMGTAGVRARANRVQNILEASSSRPALQQHHAPGASPLLPHSIQASSTKNENHSLESSWWGNSSAASQVLTSSVISIASSIGGDVHGGSTNTTGTGMSQAAFTKQLMRLMDSLTTLKGENDALLREVEAAQAAMTEARAAKEQMRRFKDEYSKRYAALSRELEEFRKSYPDSNALSEANPVTASEFGRSASASDQLVRQQEQLITNLKGELKKEKEACKKKDAALRKYESFYREVKARSAQKAAQRQKETQLRQQQQQPPRYRQNTGHPIR